MVHVLGYKERPVSMVSVAGDSAIMSPWKQFRNWDTLLSSFWALWPNRQSEDLPCEGSELNP